MLLKGEGESEGSNSDSEWDEKAQDIFKIAGGSEKTKKESKEVSQVKVEKVKPNWNFRLFYSLIDFLTCRLNLLVNKGLLGNDNQNFSSESGFLESVLSTPFVLDTN